MGFKFEAIAVPEGAKSDVLKALGLNEHGPDEYCETGFAGGLTSKGYYILWMSVFHGMFDDKAQDKIGAITDFYKLNIHEGVMYCQVECFEKNEGSAWHVIHFIEENMLLQKSGELPEFARKILSEVRAEQTKAGKDGVDYLFDGPPRIFEGATGYRYDFDQGIEFRSLIDNTATVAQPKMPVLSPSKSPWWKFW